VHAFASLQPVPSAAVGFEHWPVAESHVPATWHWSDAVQVTGLAPLHVPLWQVSVCVQASPSLQLVPFVFGVFWQLFVRPSETHAPTLQASFSDEQSLSLVQSTAFTHSDGDELGDEDGYEQTSISSAVVFIGKSACLTQHCACVSRVVQFVPVQTLPFLCAPANTSVTLLTAHDDAAVTTADPPQLSILVSSHE